MKPAAALLLLLTACDLPGTTVEGDDPNAAPVGVPQVLDPRDIVARFTKAEDCDRSRHDYCAYGWGYVSAPARVVGDRLVESSAAAAEGAVEVVFQHLNGEELGRSTPSPPWVPVVGSPDRLVMLASWGRWGPEPWVRP